MNCVKQKKAKLEHIMKREIKFRGKRTFSPNEWVYGSLLLNYKSEYHEGRHITAISYFDGFQKTAEVFPETVGQFTGFRDINGVEIYEGDIVRTVDNWNPFIVAQTDWVPYTEGEVTWIRNGFSICQKYKGANELHHYCFYDDEPAALEVIA